MQRILFYAMTEAETFDPTLSEGALRDIRQQGFEAIYLEFRNTRAPRHAPRFRAAVSFLCQTARHLGLRVLLDAHLNQFDAELIAECPEAFTDAIGLETVRCQGGRFRREVSYGDPAHLTLENAWAPQPDGRLVAIGHRCRLETQTSEGGGCAMTRHRGAAVTIQHWCIEDGWPDGELLLAVRRRFLYENRDLGHPAVLALVHRVCERAAEFDVDGLVWDEPHFGFHFLNNEVPISDRLLAAFESRFGYDLRAVLPDLWRDIPGNDSARTRLHFAGLLESELARLEQAFHAAALSHPALGGRQKQFFIGIHRTMHEELSDDFHIGCADYFLHNIGLTGGFTDSVFEREDSMVTMALLAHALGRDHGGNAWNNSWGFRPTEAHLAKYLRLLACLKVGWIGHAYHSSLLFGPGYPHHPTWATMPDHLRAHADIFKTLQTAEPIHDTALVYNWASMADATGPAIHDHRRSLLMACLELTAAGRFVRLAPPSEIPKLIAEGLDIILPWPNRLPVEAWDALENAAAQNLLFFGPPATVTREGTDCSDRWARLTGCRPDNKPLPVALGQSLAIAGESFAFDPSLAVPNWQSNPERCYRESIDAWPVETSHPIAHLEGIAVGSQQGNVRAILTEISQIPGILTRLLPSRMPIPPRDLFAFRYRQGSGTLLAVCSRSGESVTATWEYGGDRLSLDHARHAVWQLADGPTRLLTAG